MIQIELSFVAIASQEKKKESNEMQIVRQNIW